MILGGMWFPIYGIIVIFIGIILLFLLGYIIRLNIRLNRLHKKYDFFMQGASGQSIEYKLQEEVRHLYGLKDIVQKIQDEQQAILSIQNHCFCKIGLKKYDAFDNMGNQLSFAITLLNKKMMVFVYLVYMAEMNQEFLLNLLLMALVHIV
ncbi:conserved domain protein [Megasphaera sp. UPII 135-E]|nr:conserved domain protein [Megasphaera sp. UPII 135-E]